MSLAPLEVVVKLPIPAGNILKPLANLRTRTDNIPTNAFTGVPDPTGGGKLSVRNIAVKGVGDGHFTMGTGRSLDLGSVSACAFRWLYDKPADLIQSGRNLFFQTQMKGSPVSAISTASGKLDFVWRNPTTMHRDPLGSIPWHHWMYFVIVTKIAKTGGYVECFYEVDGWPGLGTPDHAHTNLNTYQGDIGHNTIGQYRDSGTGGTYTGYWDRFARAATAERALLLARA